MNTDYSVLMSVYFKETKSNLIECFDSLLNQTIIPKQIVLIQDGKLTEELDATIAEYVPKFHELGIDVLLFENEKNLGLGQSLRNGLPLCTCELIARVDTDDINVATRMEKQLEVFHRMPEVDACSTNIAEFETTPDEILAYRKTPETPEEIRAIYKKRCPVNHNAIMYKKSKVLSVDSYESVPLFEDYFLWMKMLDDGQVFYNIQENLVYARVNSEFYNRRGGYHYFKKEVHFQNLLRKRKLISFGNYLYNIMFRAFVRLLPQKLLRALYLKLLRE